MTRAVTGRFTWRAHRDGIAHAAMIVDRPGPQRAACGAHAVDPRWAWPETSRCRECEIALGFRDPDPPIRADTPI